MSRRIFSKFQNNAVLLLGIAMLSSVGCAGLAANLLYVMKGDLVPPEFAGLKGKKVAIVCVSNSTAHFDPSSAPSLLAQTVDMVLRQKMGPEIKLVRQPQIMDWIDSNNWESQDYRDIGRGVNAQMVVAIDLHKYQLHEDQTLYKGKANATVTVYDMTKNGEAVFRKNIPNFTFPVNGGQHVSETTEASFQKKFIMILAIEISKMFCPYDASEAYARDSVLID